MNEDNEFTVQIFTGGITPYGGSHKDKGLRADALWVCLRNSKKRTWKSRITFASL